MQDGKALQNERLPLFLGQNFAKTFDVKFVNARGNKICLGTSWGISTRLMGTLVMTSDDQGSVLPQIYLLYKSMVSLYTERMSS
jgi:prolyl-tRNA synthetase